MAGKLLIITLFFLSIPFSYGENYTDFFNHVKKHNRAVRISEINKKIAKAQYEKAMMISREDDEKITAEITYQSALLAYWKNTRDIHSTLFTLIIDIHIKEIEYEMLTLESRIALLDYHYYKALDDLVYTKNTDMNEAFITYKESELELRQAEWEKKEILWEFQEYTGMDWDDRYMSFVKEYTFPVITEDVWKKHDNSRAIALLRIDLAVYSVQQLPANAATYEQQLKKLEYEKTVLEGEDADMDSSAGFRTVMNESPYHLSTLSLLKDTAKQYEQELEDAHARYKKKIIPEKELLQKKIYALTLQKNYYETLKAYILSVIEVLTHTDNAPEEVLK